MHFIKGRQFVTAFLYKQMNNIFKQININTIFFFGLARFARQELALIGQR